MNSSVELFGVLAVNKPAGVTSRDVVNHVQKLIRPAKVGHTGTLDPMATGVLLLALGQATRLVELSHGQAKTYRAKFQLAVTSESLDNQSPIVPLEDASSIDTQAWQESLSAWTGVIEQKPPKYSACRVDGKRAYELARRGVQFELESRSVTIHHLQLLKFDYPHVSMQICCSSGTYIRTLGHDMAAALGSAAIMTELVRTQIGSFDLASCCELTAIRNRQDIHRSMLSPLGLVDHLARIVVTKVEASRLRHGQPIDRAVPTSSMGLQESTAQAVGQSLSSDAAISSDAVIAIDDQQQLVAVLCRRNDELWPSRVFHESPRIS